MRRTVPFGVYFVLLIAIFVVSAVATVAYVQVQSDRDARRQARSDASFAATAASKQLGVQIAAVRATVLQLAANPGLAKVLIDPTGCTLTFGAPGENGKGHLDILRLDGTAACSSRLRGKGGTLAGYVGESWLRAAVRAPVFRSPLIDKVTRAPVALFAAPAGKVVVAAFVDLTTVGSNLESVFGGNRKAEFLVLDAKSRTAVARSINPKRWIGSSLTGSGFDQAADKVERTDLDGTRRIYASSSIPGTSWTLFVGEDKARALAAGHRLRNRQLAIVLSSLALVLIATLFVYRRVVTPMKQLSDAVRTTAARGRHTPVVVSGPAEVQALAGEINALTESVNANEGVRLAKEEAERANEAKTLFLSHMSHEFRTPLAAILGFAELVQRKATDEKEKEYSGHILAGGKHLLALVNELLEISRIESGKMTLAIEPVEIQSVIREALSLAAPLAAEHHIQIEQAGNALELSALADPLRLNQVLLNLISNAIKYNRDGGRVTLSVTETPHNTVRLAVIDTGAGIPQEGLAALFTPFERLGAERGPVDGTGLGLVVTKGLIEAMNGHLEVESDVGTGTTFTVELPLAAGAPGQQRPPIAPLTPASTSGDVLYIEDNRANLELVRIILADYRPGLELRTAEDGTTGARLAEQRRPDLLLLDLNLADMTGEEVLRLLRARNETADVPILILSADSTSRNVTRLLQTGADAYLTKPLDVPQFLEIVDQLLTR